MKGVNADDYAFGMYRPEDIFGSLEVDGEGNFVGGNGNYQPSGMFGSFFGLDDAVLTGNRYL